MTLAPSSVSPGPRPARKYLRPPAPLHFPVEERVPETELHYRARVMLYQCIEFAFRGRATVSCDQFVYFDAGDPKQYLSPDVALRMCPPSGLIDSWKTWERGAPEVGVEILSRSDDYELAIERKLERYRRAGIREVVVFDSDEPKSPLRLFDLIDGDLVERELSDPESVRCDALGCYWQKVQDPVLGPVLRLSRDAAGSELLPTPEEAARAREEAARAREEAARAREEAALARVRELEAELAKRR